VQKQVKETELLNFHHSRDKLRSEKSALFRARRASFACADPGFAGVMPLRGMPGAFCHGTVKN
jgi:hypothetical protein